jgi:hypothetical protein
MILILSLAVWRLSHMIVKEPGPLNVFAKLRADRARKQKRIGGAFDMLSCVACVSIYIGAVTALGAAGDVFSWIVYTLALSAIATILEQGYVKIKS